MRIVQQADDPSNDWHREATGEVEVNERVIRRKFDPKNSKKEVLLPCKFKILSNCKCKSKYNVLTKQLLYCNYRETKEM